jgi:hypothetical protein
MLDSTGVCFLLYKTLQIAKATKKSGPPVERGRYTGS